MTDIQSISDAKGNPVGVIVPIEIWHEIESRKETAYLTKSETMKKRLLEVKGRGETDRNFWLLTSEDSLNEIWNNEEDDIYAETPDLSNGELRLSAEDLFLELDRKEKSD